MGGGGKVGLRFGSSCNIATEFRSESYHEGSDVGKLFAACFAASLIYNGLLFDGRKARGQRVTEQ